MKVTLVADSCFIFEHAGIRILTDPWIGTSIAGGSWVQYPPPVLQVGEIGRLDYIFISHIHEDHCDIQTLKKLDLNAEIIIMERKPNFVKDFLNFHELKFKKIINLRVREKLQITKDFMLEVVEANPEHKLNYLVDSSLIIHYEGKSIYFANDNPPYAELSEYLSQYNFELAIIPPVGGSGYPAFYENLNNGEKKIKANSIMLSYFKEMISCLRRIKPRLYTIAANGHVLSGLNSKYNEFMCWPENNNMPFKYIRDNLHSTDKFLPIILKPGDSIHLEESKGVSHDLPVLEYDNRIERAKYINDIAHKIPYFYENFELRPSINFEKLLKFAYESLVEYFIINKISINMTYIIPFPVGQKTKYVFIEMFGNYELKFSDINEVINNYLVVKVEPRVLYFLLTGGFSWNIADATGFIKYNRKPDIYHYDTYICLNFLRI